MTTTTAPMIDTAQIEQALVAADPAVCFAPPRILRRVIKADRRIIGIGLRVPHVKSYVIGRDALLKLATRDELNLPPGRELPETVILLVRPESDKFATLSRDEALVLYWRLLFHARVHVALGGRVAEGGLTEAGVRHRIQRVGRTEFDAVRDVLRQENFLMPPRDDRTAFVEFAALYLELRHFAPGLLPHYFPGLTDRAGIDALLADDVDSGEVLARSRPQGAPDLAAAPNGANRREERHPEEPPPSSAPSEAEYRALVERADRARAVGNVVRAAVLRMQAAAVAQPKRVRGARNAARAELNVLVDRLQPALGLDDAEARAWRQLLPSLLASAARGVWPVEARLLYDLQKVCVDYERELYAADLVEWLRSGFRRPIKRPLPDQREVLLLKHLRGAGLRLRGARTAEEERARLGQLFLAAVRRKEAALRQRFRPRIHAVLDEVGLVPQNLPEQVARDKLVEELLDRVVERGFSTMGDLRDSLARSQLKLPDLAGPGELVTGDRLLRADKRLAIAFEGVSHRGEAYLRLFQRLSALSFGTRAGRFVMRYLALPFVGAYAVIVGLMEIIDLAAEFVFRAEHFHSIALMRPLVHSWAVRLSGADHYLPIPPDATREEVRAVRHGDHLLQMEHTLSRALLTGVLGLFFFLLLHVPPFRRAVFGALELAYRGLHGALIDLPAALLHWPPLRRVLASRPFALVLHYLLKPAVAAALSALALWLDDAARAVTVPLTLAVFLGSNLLLNSRLGRDVEEVLADGLVRGWQRLKLEIVPDLVHWVMDVFKTLLGAFDRLLYAVDEWLRFRGGQSRATFAAKAVLGLSWFTVAYLARFVVVVFVEPTFNPIKHFPTVTVAAKLLLPFYPAWVKSCEGSLYFLGHWVAGGVGAVVFLLLPGLAGFLVWELKENWRLYAANRPPALAPVMVGSHGETVVRLLRPGLHSGTLPKLYAKLRKAERRAARRGGDGDTVRKHRAALHHVGEQVRHFLEREFLDLLNASTFWRGTPLGLGAVELAANRIRAEVHCPALSAAALALSFEERSGRLLAGACGPGWPASLSPEQSGALRTALAGLYKLAGAELVRQQIEALLPPAVTSYDVVDAGLAVWSGDEAEAVYPLGGAAAEARPAVTAGAFPAPLPPLPAALLSFAAVEVTWAWWVAAWEGDRAGKPHPPLPVAGLCLLPEAVAHPAEVRSCEGAVTTSAAPGPA